MRVISFNVNGIRSMRTKGKNGEKDCDPSICGIQKLIDEKNPDFLCFQETKTNSLIDLQPYKGKHPHIYAHFSERKKGYSGVAILSKHEALACHKDFTRFSEESFLPYSHFDFVKEGRMLTLEFPTFCLITVYTPNSKSNLERLDERMEWDRLFREYIKKLEEETNKPIIACGDLNVAPTELDLCRAKGNERSAGFTIEERQSFMKLLEECNMINTFRHLNPTVRKYSWWSAISQARLRNAGWLIDHILASNSLITDNKLVSSEILNEYWGSDHCPVMAHFAHLM